MSYPSKYPEPFLQNGKKPYVFDYVAPDGSRKRRNTYRDTKKEARQEIRAFLDRLYDPNAVDEEIRQQTFRQFAEPFFVEERCPRAQRLRGERNISGGRSSTCASGCSIEPAVRKSTRSTRLSTRRKLY